MSVNAWPSEVEPDPIAALAEIPPSKSGQPLGSGTDALQGVRVRGGVDLTFQARGGRTWLASTRERDGYKVRMPREAGACQAVLINTGGGVAGGDRVAIHVDAGTDTRACVSTSAAERVYKAASAAPAIIDVDLKLGPNAAMNWLPQETIVFDRARLNRTINVALTGSSRLLFAETLVLGRAAMGETLNAGDIRDCWRVRRDGRLIFAEDVRLEDDIVATLAGAASADGANTVATVVAVAPDIADRLGDVRARLEDVEAMCAASSWNDILLVRILGRRGALARRALEYVLPVLSDDPLPRVWAT